MSILTDQAVGLLRRADSALQNYHDNGGFTTSTLSNQVILSSLNSAAGAISDFLSAHGEELDTENSELVTQLGQKVDDLAAAARGELSHAQASPTVTFAKDLPHEVGKEIEKLAPKLPSPNSVMLFVVVVLALLAFIAYKK